MSQILSDIDKSRLRECESLLSMSFMWSESDEGQEYWETVSKKLLHYANRKEKTEKVRK